MLLALALALPLALALVLVLPLVLVQPALLLAWPGRPVRPAGSEEATDRNPAGAQASVTVVARVAHSRRGRAADTSPAHNR